MPSLVDAVGDSAEAHAALRALAHATRSMDVTAEGYEVIGNLMSSMQSLSQVLDQLARMHAGRRGAAVSEKRDPEIGATEAAVVAYTLRRAADEVAMIGGVMEIAHEHASKIVWQAQARSESQREAVESTPTASAPTPPSRSSESGLGL